MTLRKRSTPAVFLALLFALWAAGALPAAAQEHGGHAGHGSGAPAPVYLSTQEKVQLQIPDVPVLDQDGKPRRFYTDLVRGKVVAMNFMFTNCTTICPPLGITFANLRKLLGDRAGRDVHLVSISVDPVADTPARLKAWAQQFGHGPGWTLVTGKRDDMARLLKALGAFTPDMNDHPPLVLIGNDARHDWTRAYGLAPPPMLAGLIDQAAKAPAKQAKGGKR